MGKGKSLTVGCTAGLGNRLRVLASGLALAEAGGRSFRMLWPRTFHCSASFHELFANPLPVEESSLAATCALVDYSGERSSRLPDILAGPEIDITVLGFSWITDSARFPNNQGLQPRCEEIIASLQPIPEIADRIAEFRVRNFRPKMIGVHLRRGDMPRHRMASVGNAIAATEGYLEQFPDAGILLCTDDGAPPPWDRENARDHGVRGRFRRCFGDRVVWTAPRYLDRAYPVSIQDAVADLWLLRGTDALVASAGSSFSEIAAFGRSIPIRWCKSDNRRYNFIETVLRKAGIYPALKRDSMKRFGTDLRFPDMVDRYRREFRRRLEAFFGKGRSY